VAQAGAFPGSPFLADWDGAALGCDFCFWVLDELKANCQEPIALFPIRVDPPDPRYGVVSGVDFGRG
jgi:hypothetical protein